MKILRAEIRATPPVFSTAPHIPLRIPPPPLAHFLREPCTALLQTPAALEVESFEKNIVVNSVELLSGCPEEGHS